MTAGTAYLCARPVDGVLERELAGSITLRLLPLPRFDVVERHCERVGA